MTMTNTQQKIVARSVWFSTAMPLPTSPFANHVSILREDMSLEDWKREGRVFSIEHDGIDFYPAYQFSKDGSPLPIIRELLIALADTNNSTNPWAVAAWFVYPNGWIEQDGQPCVPKDVLDWEDELRAAAKNYRGTYVA